MVFFRRKPAEVLSGKVVVFGATTPLGQSLSLLLKLSPHVKQLVCLSTAAEHSALPAMGVAADLSHTDTETSVMYGVDESDWPAAVRNAQIVLVCSGQSFDPLREDAALALRSVAPSMEPVMHVIAKHAPRALIGIVSSPVNALVPLCAEHLKRASAFDPRRLFGVTTLDVIRARRLVAEAMNKNPFDVNIPVVGGRGGVTAVPLIAQTGLQLPPEAIVRITSDVQRYGAPFNGAREDVEGRHELTTEVAPPVSLGLAYAAHEFAMSLLKAQRGDVGIIECAYTESSMRPETPFFAGRLLLGIDGVERLLPMGALTAFENELVDAAVPRIAEDVQLGLSYLQHKTSSTKSDAA